MLKKLLALIATGLVALSLSAQAQQAATNPYLQYTPPPTPPILPIPPINPLNFLLPPGAATAPTKPYTMRRAITQEEKIQMMQMALPIMTNIMGMQMADSMNYFARKYKVKPGLTLRN